MATEAPLIPWKHWSSERLGIALAILAALGFSFKAIFVKLAYAVPQTVAVDSVTLLSLRMIFSLPFFLWIGFHSSRSASPLSRRDGLILVALGLLGYISALIQPLPIYAYAAGMAIFSTVLPVFWQSAAIRRIGASKAVLLGTLGPILTIFFGWWLLAEPLSLTQIAGAGLVLTGVWLVSRRPAQDAG